MKMLPQLRKNVKGAEIKNPVNRIESKGVDVEFGQPIEGVLDEKSPDSIAVRTIEIQGCSPRGPVSVSEVRGKLLEIVSLCSKVVVDDIEHDSEPRLMARVDKLFQAVRAPIRRVRSIEIDPIVAPVAAAGKFRYWHQLHGSNPEHFQIRELGNDGFECTFSGKCARMKFVDDVIMQCEAGPVSVRPGVRAWIYNSRGAMNAEGLPTRDRIGTLGVFVEDEQIIDLRLDVRNVGFEVFTLTIHRKQSPGNLHGHVHDLRRPDPQMRTPSLLARSVF